MGQPKLALPWAGRTVLECVLEVLRLAGVNDILVIVGPHGDELIPLISKNAHVLRLAEETPDMQATVLQGLRWIEKQFHPGNQDDWLLLPADHPALDPGVVRELLRCRAEHPERSIFIPTFEGRRGHPVLVGWRHVGALQEFPTGQGLNRFFRQHDDSIKECPVGVAGILADLDTPDDYRRLAGR